ncbi:MAG: XdhC family protein [Firmicutes bacterium]|nr:XdhC family protein [Bacillota bacterium]
MKKLYESCAHSLSRGEDIVIATIIQQDGSAPRTAGTKMLIRRDGSFEGTIGGGLLEARVLQFARDVFEKGQSICEKFFFTGADVNSLDMICGGEAVVFIDLVMSSFSENVLLYQYLANLTNERQKAFLVSRIVTGEESRDCLKQCILLEDKAIGMQLSDKQKEQFLQVNPGRYPSLITLDGEQFLIEPLHSPSTVYLCGAGHVSQRIAQLASLVGFRTIVIDDREEFASRERFPWADEIAVVKNFACCFQNFEVDRNSFLVIVTRGHKFDMVALAQALETDACYIGMIGSRRKRDAIYKALRENGVSEEQLARVYSPIGLDIKAETPEEIAVSIVAELIKVRAEQGNV